MVVAAGGHRFRGCLLAASICLSASPSLAVPAPSPGAVRADISRLGPRGTIENLTNTGAWEALISRVGAGDEAYIALVPALRQGSDAGWSEDMRIGLAEALPKNPQAVLRLIGPDSDPVLAAKRVCDIPFIEIPKAEVETYRGRARSAVVQVGDASLAGQRAACLAALKP